MFLVQCTFQQHYYGKWTPDSADMANWTKWTGKPFIVTEYYTKGEDSGMPNTSGAGRIVRTMMELMKELNTQVYGIITHLDK